MTWKSEERALRLSRFRKARHTNGAMSVIRPEGPEGDITKIPESNLEVIFEPSGPNEKLRNGVEPQNIQTGVLGLSTIADFDKLVQSGRDKASVVGYRAIAKEDFEKFYQNKRHPEMGITSIQRRDSDKESLVQILEWFHWQLRQRIARFLGREPPEYVIMKYYVPENVGKLRDASRKESFFLERLIHVTHDGNEGEKKSAYFDSSGKHLHLITPSDLTETARQMNVTTYTNQNGETIYGVRASVMQVKVDIATAH